MKSRQIKKRSIIIDKMQYVYSVTEYTDDIQIRVYKNKILILIMIRRFSFKLCMRVWELEKSIKTLTLL